MRTTLLVVLVSSCLLACPPPGACPTTGTGAIVVTFSGLPAGVDGSVTLTGAAAQTLTSAQTVMVGAGHWSVSAATVTAADPRVRSVYAPRVSAPEFCLGNGSSMAVTVTWEKVPTSNRLWVGSGAGGMGNLHGLDSAVLAATGTAASAWNANTAGSGSVTFDREGNLWALGNTTSDPLVARFGAAGFATATASPPDRRIEVPGIGCFPRSSALAFDRDGNLYVASGCKSEVYKLPAASLGASGTVTPSLTLTGLMAPSGLAFDASGNLYVADTTLKEIHRYDAASLGGATATAASKIRVKANTMPADTALFDVRMLAFDAAGNLWTYDFGANVIFHVPSADLAGTGTRTVQPGVRISVSVTALLEGLAFDEGGGLWFPFTSRRLARLSPAQLTVSTGPGAPTDPETVITGSTLGSASDPAFFPAPKGTPLFHALP